MPTIAALIQIWKLKLWGHRLHWQQINGPIRLNNTQARSSLIDTVHRKQASSDAKTVLQHVAGSDLRLVQIFFSAVERVQLI